MRRPPSVGKDLTSPPGPSSVFSIGDPLQYDFFPSDVICKYVSERVAEKI